jgi:hypothetical protein
MHGNHMRMFANCKARTAITLASTLPAMREHTGLTPQLRMVLAANVD